jgi:hypothetical protein
MTMTASRKFDFIREIMLETVLEVRLLALSCPLTETISHSAGYPVILVVASSVRFLRNFRVIAS